MSKRYLGLDYLRALLIVRVVAFHSVLAYADFGSLSQVIAPVADSRRWGGFELFIRLSDIFGMPLIFFISGLFVWPSLARKGALGFALGRGVRLGIPFVLAVIFLMPLAFYPAYRAHGLDLDLVSYWQKLFTDRVWSAGPLWFIWLLLVFDLLAAGLYRVAPGAGAILGRLTAGAARRPLRYFLAFIACAAVAYIPLLVGFGPWRWVALGPFGLQPSRVLHYALYFFTGVGIGAHGIGRGPLGEASLLVGHWFRWVLAALALHAFFAVWLFPLVGAFAALSPWLAAIVYGLVFVSTCAATGFALLAVCQRFLTRRIVAGDSLAANSYGIYVMHYFFVLWVQYLLLDWALPAVVKAGLVFASALASSWLCAALFRRVPLRHERRSQAARSVPDT